MRLANPEYKPHDGLGQTTAEWDALKLKITTYLRTKAGDSTVPEEEVRDLDVKFRDPKIWAQISGELELLQIPD